MIKKLYKSNNETANFSELQFACIEGSEEMIKILLSSGLYDINETCGDYGFSTLMILIFNEQYDLAKLLIEYNADVNIHDTFRNTPLTYMIKYSQNNEKINEKMYELLLDHGAYIDYELFEQDDEFITSFINHRRMIQFLWEKKLLIRYNKSHNNNNNNDNNSSSSSRKSSSKEKRQNVTKPTLIQTPLLFETKLNNNKLMKALTDIKNQK